MAENKSAIPVRDMWTGTISFGLVSVPVSLFPALRRRPVNLRLLSGDGTPLKKQYVCSADGKVLSADDIVRGYELAGGRIISVSDDELGALAPERTGDIELKEFVDMKVIDPFYYERPYYLAPASRSTKAYRLLAQVMEKKGLAGIATFVMRGKEHLVAILAERGILMAETLRFADEIRQYEHADVGVPEGTKAKEELVNLWSRRITALSRRVVDKKDLADQYAKRFQKLVSKKRKTRAAVVTAVPEEDEAEGEEEGWPIIDLVAVFKQRMQEAAEA